MLIDSRTAVAFNEIIPITNMSLGKFAQIPHDLHQTRLKYEKLITLTNSFIESPPKIKCDCCLSSTSQPYENNQIVYCRICLAGIHIKCHGRSLAHTYTQALKDFICERCRYMIDNKVEEIDAIRCRFCDELKGIMIYCEKNVDF